MTETDSSGRIEVIQGDITNLEVDVPTSGRVGINAANQERGGRNAAIVYSVLQTCKSLGINPQEYLEDVLPRILDHNSSRIAELLPDRWAAARAAQPLNHGGLAIKTTGKRTLSIRLKIMFQIRISGPHSTVAKHHR